tara:strand:- start:52 stop:240 length:189 start_codon:yes stop_codon:yes gene_type:complete
MSDRQVYLDRIRELKKDLGSELKNGKFVKEVEPFQLREAMNSLTAAEAHINGYLQIDKYRGG